jgi:hypothetical protein
VPPSSGSKICQTSSEQKTNSKFILLDFFNCLIILTSILNTEAVCPSETSLNFFRTIYLIRQNNLFHSRRYVNFSSNMLDNLFVQNLVP